MSTTTGKIIDIKKKETDLTKCSIICTKPEDTLAIANSVLSFIHEFVLNNHHGSHIEISKDAHAGMVAAMSCAMNAIEYESNRFGGNYE